nr:hypothetical protein HmN_000791300 [Hymenolepis microstoma]
MIMVIAGDTIYIRKGKHFSEIFEYHYKPKNGVPAYAEYGGKCTLAYVDPDNDSDVLIWTVKKHELLRIKMQSPITAMVVSPDVSFLALSTESGLIRIYSHPFCQKEYQEFKPGLPEKARIYSMKLALKGIFLSCSSNDNKVYIFQQDGHRFIEYAYVDLGEIIGREAKRVRKGYALFRNFLYVAASNGLLCKFELSEINLEPAKSLGKFNRKVKLSTALSCDKIGKYVSNKMHTLPSPTQTTINTEMDNIEDVGESVLNTKDDLPDCLFDLAEVSIFMEEKSEVSIPTSAINELSIGDQIETADEEIIQETESEEISVEFVKFDPYESGSDESVVTVIHNIIKKKDNTLDEEDGKASDFNTALANDELQHEEETSWQGEVVSENTVQEDYIPNEEDDKTFDFNVALINDELQHEEETSWQREVVLENTVHMQHSASQLQPESILSIPTALRYSPSDNTISDVQNIPQTPVAEETWFSLSDWRRPFSNNTSIRNWPSQHEFGHLPTQTTDQEYSLRSPENFFPPHVAQMPNEGGAAVKVFTTEERFSLLSKWKRLIDIEFGIYGRLYKLQKILRLGNDLFINPSVPTGALGEQYFPQYPISQPRFGQQQQRPSTMWPSPGSFTESFTNPNPQRYKKLSESSK